MKRGVICRDVNFNARKGQHGGCQYMEKNRKTSRHMSSPPITTLYRSVLLPPDSKSPTHPGAIDVHITRMPAVCHCTPPDTN